MGQRGAHRLEQLGVRAAERPAAREVLERETVGGRPLDGDRAGAAAAPGPHQSSALQLAVGAGDGADGERQVARQLTDGGSRSPG